MASPSGSDQGKKSPPSAEERESSQDSSMDVKVKDEPTDAGYEADPPVSSENHSSSNSRASSPPASVPRETDSPSQDVPDNPPSPRAEEQQVPLNDVSGSSIRSQVQGITGKKVDTVQNIVEGLLKKNANLLAMNDAEGLRPNTRRLKGPENLIRRGDLGRSTVFPISSVSQARLVPSTGNSEKRKMMDTNTTRFLRPRSPTRKCESILRDNTQLSYALMEANVGDQEIENIFRVQHHELVCAVSLKSYVGDRDKVVAVLDKSYYWCNFCSFSSTNKELLTQHIMDHRFRCNFCPYESFCRSDILRHMAASHSEFSAADDLNYCTFLSDYLRVKSRAEKIENNLPCVNPDDDVKDLDKDEMEATVIRNEKRKKEEEEEMYASQEKRARLEDNGKVTDSSEAAQTDRHGKSRKSQNPRRHPQPSEDDYDTFEMEVEEINDYAENGTSDYNSERVMYPSHVTDDGMDQAKNAPSMVSRMQIIPSIQDEGRQGFTTTHISSPAPPRPGPGRPTKTPCPFNKTKRTSGSTSLYWSCGYCDFQSGSQAEIKEHSNRTHPGKPHRCKKKLHKQSKTSKSGDKASKRNHDDSLAGSKRGGVSASGVQNPTDVHTETCLGIANVCQKTKSNMCSSNVSVVSVCNDESSLDKGLDGKQKCQSRCRQGIKSTLSLGLNSRGDKNALDKCVDRCDRDSSIEDLSGHGVKVQCNKNTKHNVPIISETKNLLEKCTVTNENDDSVSLVESDNNEKDRLSKSNDVLSEKSLKASENLSSSLKITFKTVGQVTTCSMNEGKDSNEESIPIPIQSGFSVVDNNRKEEVRWEDELLDSSDGSASDISSNPRSTALSVSSVSEVFDHSFGSPVSRDTLQEPKMDENEADIDKRPEKLKSEPRCNENVIKLSPPYEEEEEENSKPVEISLSCVPARSAAMKAMTRMKPTLEMEAGEEKPEKDLPGCQGIKKQALKSKPSHIKSPLHCNVQAHSRNPSANFIKSLYTCGHCSEMKMVTLEKMKSHLKDTHTQQQPVVINTRRQPDGKKQKKKLLVCLYPSCKKLVKKAVDLDYHKNEHHSFSVPAKPKERKTMNSLSTSSISSITEVLHHNVSSPDRTKKAIPDCCVKLHHLDLDQLSHYTDKHEVGRYECLYCTEDSFYCDKLSEIKIHHFSEHSSQLLVLRDVEAKKSQLPSRIYLCDDTGCDFQSFCRNDIITHSSSHSANCTSVYECPSCGWYSSSYSRAEDHVQNVHADEENISLIRMQLSVDENGQTSKKILR